jgi:hypothetical protein
MATEEKSKFHVVLAYTSKLKRVIEVFWCCLLVVEQNRAVLKRSKQFALLFSR